MIFAKNRFLALPLDLAFGRAGRWKTCFCLHPFLDLPLEVVLARAVDLENDFCSPKIVFYM
jgi:hypothetical protein